MKLEHLDLIAGILKNHNQATFRIYGYTYGDTYIVLNFDDGDIIVHIEYRTKEITFSKLIERDRLESVTEFAQKEKEVEALFNANKE